MHAKTDDIQQTPPQRGVATFRYHRPRRGPWLQLLDLSTIEWNTLDLVILDLPANLDGTRLLHIGDLHLRTRWPKALDEVIARINANPPDLLLFTGDFVDDRRDHRPALGMLRKLLSSIHGRHGAFATTGNHDGDLLLPRLSSLGVRVIMNQRIDVPVRDGGTIEIIGFPGPERADLSETFLHSIPPRRQRVPRIVLSHYPDLIRAATAAGIDPDLFLAGHTHGGQVCLPNECALLTHDSLPRRMCKGASDYQGTCLFVSRGAGFTTLPIRLFCPAEVVEIVLRRKDEG